MSDKDTTSVEYCLIPGFPKSRVGMDGSVWSLKRGGWKRLRCGRDRDGYVTVEFSKNGKVNRWRVHRLVLELFVGPRPEGMECRHLNGKPDDNRIENLTWGTRSENRHDAKRHGTNMGGPKLLGEDHPRAILTADKVRAMRLASQNGQACVQISQDFGFSFICVWKAITRRTWKHII
jgi:HNH endonuclease